jgi:hypothetical protein
MIRRAPRLGRSLFSATVPYAAPVQAQIAIHRWKLSSSEARMIEINSNGPTSHASVKRCRRSGMDRLCVNKADGPAIGWFEL